MELNRVVDDLNLEKTHLDILRTKWEESQKLKPEGKLPFLTDKFVEKACGRVYLSEEIIKKAVCAARRIEENASLSALLWHGHYCLARCDDYPADSFSRWPAPDILYETLKEDAGMFYLLLLLSVIPRMFSELSVLKRKRSIPDEIMRDTLSGMEVHLNNYRSATMEKESAYAHRLKGVPKGGRPAWGLTPNLIGWFTKNAYRGELFRLGRLQFQFSSFRGQLYAFRHQSSGTVLALSEDGVQYLAGGQLYSERRSTVCGETWNSELAISGERITGNPIHPTGRAIRWEVSLPADEWSQILTPKDPVLAIHIPAGRPLSFEQCGQSFERAMEFFPRHFPDRPFAAFVCSSWILDSQLEILLPPASNMVKFQKEVYLYPTRTNDEDLLRRAFGKVPEDLEEAPRDTTLRRALIDYLHSGRSLTAGAGGCFLFPSDFDWGSQVYRSQTPPRSIFV